MTAPIGTECPEPAQLRRLIRGMLTLEEQSHLTAHLDCCESCQKAIEHIAAGGSALLDVAGRAMGGRPEDTSAYWPALRQLEREILNSTASAVTVDGQGGLFEDISLEFLDPAIEPGTLGKLGRFHVVEVIGQGGMGLVMRALDECLQRQVALKVLDPRYVKNDLARNRFIREARAAASITHENVVAVHHVEKHRNDIPFLIMRLVTGESLQNRLDSTKGPLELRQILRIGRQIAAGLAAAHEQTLIHRDIKPANILLESVTGRVLLTDFGLARAAEDVKLTQTGFVAGTPLYMSPEQARGELLDHRSDLFSLGGVLYAMCSGSPPFQGTSPYVVLREVTEGKHRDLKELNPELPDELVTVVDRLLAKSPNERIQSAAEVADALAEIEANWNQNAVRSTPRRSTSTQIKASNGWWRRHGQQVAAVLIVVIGLILLSEFTKLTQWTRLGQRGQVAVDHRSPANVAPEPQSIGTVPEPWATLDAGTGPIWGVAFSPDGTLLVAAIDDGSVKLWDVKNAKLKSRIPRAHNGPVRSIAFNRDGTMFATAGEDGLVKLWDPRTNRDIDWIDLRIPAHAVAFSADGKRIATGSRNGAVRVWDAQSRKSQVVTQDGHARAVTTLAFSTDGKYLASGSDDRTLKIWDLSDDEGREVITFAEHTGSIHAVVFQPTSSLLASAGWDRTIRIWDIDQGKQVGKLEGHAEDVWSLAFSSDGRRLVSTSEDRTAKIWDVGSQQELRTLKGHVGSVYGLAMTSDDSLIATASRDGMVRIWRTTD